MATWNQGPWERREDHGGGKQIRKKTRKGKSAERIPSSNWKRGANSWTMIFFLQAARRTIPIIFFILRQVRKPVSNSAALGEQHRAKHSKNGQPCTLNDPVTGTASSFRRPMMIFADWDNCDETPGASVPVNAFLKRRRWRAQKTARRFPGRPRHKVKNCRMEVVAVLRTLGRRCLVSVFQLGPSFAR